MCYSQNRDQCHNTSTSPVFFFTPYLLLTWIAAWKYNAVSSILYFWYLRFFFFLYRKEWVHVGRETGKPC